MADLTDLAERIAQEPVAATPPRQLLDRELQRRRRRRVPAGLVAAVVLTGIVLGSLALSRAGDGEPATRLAPVGTGAAVDACRSRIERLEAERGPIFERPFLASEVDEIVVLPLPASPAAEWVLMLGRDGSYACRVLRAATADADVSEFSMASGLVPTRPESGTIRVLIASWLQSPPRVEVIGRVGEGATAVELRLPDGRVLPGHITDGWFVIDGKTTADAASAGEGTVAWTVDGGEVTTAGLSELHSEVGPRFTDDAAAVPASRTGSTWDDGEVYPLLGPVDDLDVDVYPTMTGPSAERPKVTSMVLGRRRGDTLDDIATILVHDPARDDSARRRDGTRKVTRLGTRDVEVVESGGDRRYVWDVGAMSVTLDDTPDAEALVETVEASPGPDGGWPELRVDELPDGLEVLDGPSHWSDVPEPGFSSRGSTSVELEILVGPALGLAGATGSVEIVTVDALEGYVTEVDGALQLTWPAGPDAWVWLMSRGLDKQRVLQIAADMTFVDQPTWEATYDIDVDHFSVPPTTAPPDAIRPG